MKPSATRGRTVTPSLSVALPQQKICSGPLRGLGSASPRSCGDTGLPQAEEMLQPRRNQCPEIIALFLTEFDLRRRLHRKETTRLGRATFKAAILPLPAPRAVRATCAAFSLKVPADVPAKPMRARLIEAGIAALKAETGVAMTRQ